MKRRQHAGYMAHCLNEHLLEKVGKHITRREHVLANTHRYCFDKLSHIIEETNQQVNYTASKAKSIPDTADINPQKPDSMMSVPEPSYNTKNRRLSEANSIKSKEKKQRKFSFMTRQRRSVTCSDFSFIYNEIRKHQQQQQQQQRSRTITQAYSTIVPLEVESDEEEDKYIEILRRAKELQAQEEEKQRQRLFEINRKRVRVDLSSQRVMFDYECKVSKLDPPKVRDMPEMFEIQGWMTQDQKIKNLSPYSTERGRDTSFIKNVINITEKNSEKQKERLKYVRTKYRKAQEEQASNFVPPQVVVNPQAHKQIEKAYRPENQGIKIKIEDREIIFKKEPKIKETTIKRRLSKAEFVQFKKNQEKRKKSMLMKFKNEERSKSEVKIITEPIEEQAPDQKQQTSQQHELRYPKSQSDNGGERIVVTNRLMMSDLLREYKDKENLRSVDKPSPKTNNSTLEMSTVDRYNLLYVKYAGKPPDNMLEVAKELRFESNQVAKRRQKGTPSTGLKYSWLGGNRLNTFRNKQQKQRMKTQV